MKMFVVRMSRFCIAISICDCLLQTPNSMIMIFSAAWGVALELEGILMYFQETQGVLPGRFKI